MFPMSLFLLGGLRKLLQGSWSQKWAQAHDLWVFSSVEVPRRRQVESAYESLRLGYMQRVKAKEHRRGLAPLVLRAAGWPRPAGGGGCIVGALAWVILEEACSVRERHERKSMVLSSSVMDLQMSRHWLILKYRNSVSRWCWRFRFEQPYLGLLPCLLWAKEMFASF